MSGERRHCPKPKKGLLITVGSAVFRLGRTALEDPGGPNCLPDGEPLADDWLSCPNLPRHKKLLNAVTGGWEGIIGHHVWWMTHLPHGSGITDGFYNNWWQYIANYDQAIKELPPPGASFQKAKVAMYAPD